MKTYTVNYIDTDCCNLWRIDSEFTTYNEALERLKEIRRNGSRWSWISEK